MLYYYAFEKKLHKLNSKVSYTDILYYKRFFSLFAKSVIYFIFKQYQSYVIFIAERTSKLVFLHRTRNNHVHMHIVALDLIGYGRYSILSLIIYTINLNFLLKQLRTI